MDNFSDFENELNQEAENNQLIEIGESLDTIKKEKPVRRKSRYSNKKKSRLPLFIIFIIILIAFILIKLVNKDSDSDISGFNVDFEQSLKTDFYIKDNNIFYMTKDGINFYSSDNKNIWNDTYNSLNPVMLSDDKFVAVADVNGSLLRVYNFKGKQYDVPVNNTISLFCVNKDGYSAYLTEKDSQYACYIYNVIGEKVHEIFFASESIVPVSIDISDDSRIFAVSYLSLEEINMVSKVSFYYINDEEFKSTDNSEGNFASFQKENSIITNIHFLEKNYLMALSDNELICVKCDDGNLRFSEKWSYPLTNKVNSISYSENKYAVLGLGESINGLNNGYKNGQVLVFNTGKDIINEYNIGGNIDKIFSNDKGSVVKSGRKFIAVGNKRKKIWEFTGIQDIKKVLMVDNNEALVVSNINAAIRNIRNYNSSAGVDEADNQSEE